ncbi:hypothetical protein [Branchiibius sp. NY16-3462-2]|uniref:hypothetical protein n=1 Tax=Branchiibius sp. NY16-3462-2 TaxID=1807500 RepID=UPI0025C67FA7|nr:hypothetical protein [Branchiibius sp. NY16-3462-2]
MATTSEWVRRDSAKMYDALRKIRDEAEAALAAMEMSQMPEFTRDLEALALVVDRAETRLISANAGDPDTYRMHRTMGVMDARAGV